MATSGSETITRVKVAVDELAEALARGDTDAVLAGEITLADCAFALTRVDAATLQAEREHVRRLIRDTQLRIAQCRRLGAVAGDLLAILSHGSSYGPDGLQVSALASSRVHLRS
jgi:hypothetical protein